MEFKAKHSVFYFEFQNERFSEYVIPVAFLLMGVEEEKDYESSSKPNTIRNTDFTFKVTGQGNKDGGHIYAVRSTIEATGNREMTEAMDLMKVILKKTRSDGENFPEYLAQVAQAIGIKTIVFKAGINKSTNDNFGYSRHTYDFVDLATGCARIASILTEWQQKHKKTTGTK